jgi:hypothetical protein
MSELSNRHESDLAGMLRPFGETESVNITIEIPEVVAGLPATQHTAWMLLNQLTRLAVIVGRIGLICPEGIPLAGNICPLAERNLDLRSALIAGSRAISGVPVILDERFDRRILVGPNDATKGVMHVYGEGWSGGFSGNAIKGGSRSSLPIGPYIAAALATSEIFKAARMRPGSYEPSVSVFYSAWNHSVATELDLDGPSVLPDLTIDMALAGVGAVGSTWVHVLWAIPGLDGRVILADNDAAGVDVTNLNRYPLFGRPSLGRAKGFEAARIAKDCGIAWEAYDGGLETYGSLPPRVISAVDRNRSRHAIQRRYPARILSASTSDLRCEVLRCGPPGHGACLGCNNPPETIASDAELRAMVQGSSAQERERLLAATGLRPEDTQEWIEKGKCGVASQILLPYLRQQENSEPALFAVGFTSVMAGTFLAAESIKDLITHPEALSDTIQRAVFQFWRPLSRSNGAEAWLRDPECPLCTPGSDAARIWSARYLAFS